MFATGIENSIPKIQGGKVRVDQMEACGHYRHWRKDFDLVEEMGLQYLRYGPPFHTTLIGPDKHDWEFTDVTFAELKRRDIIPIVDLCHFGVPDWIGDFQNPDFPEVFANYARAFAQRFPWVQLYTPVNEMFICAQFSAKYGWWNEEGTTDLTFVTALKHIVKANVRAMQEILKIRADAIFIQSESSEYFHAENPAAIGPAEIENSKRFLSLDLLLGHDVSATMYQYLLNSGMTAEEYRWYMGQRDVKRHCVMGTDYYVTNEHVIKHSGQSIGAGDVYGYYVITRQYFDRYKLPVMHTETNRVSKHAIEWLWKEWMNLLRLRDDGVPIIGFTWFGLVDMKDWDTALTQMRGTVNKVGLYTLDRRPRRVAREYRRMVEEYSALPISSSKFPILTS